jgi:predicted metallopeptidase
MRGHGSKSKALARIWGLSRIWQKAFGIKSYYK